VAYDEDLADRIRELMATERGLSEQQMFGGLAFLVGGNMAVSASGRGGLMVRVDPADTDRLVATTKASRMVMRGREMDGWLRVDTADVRTKRQLAVWVARGTAYARSLPAKDGAEKAAPKKAAPKRAASKRAAPKRAAPKKAAPKKASASRRR